MYVKFPSEMQGRANYCRVRFVASVPCTAVILRQPERYGIECVYKKYEKNTMIFRDLSFLFVILPFCINKNNTI